MARGPQRLTDYTSECNVVRPSCTPAETEVPSPPWPWPWPLFTFSDKQIPEQPLEVRVVGLVVKAEGAAVVEEGRQLTRVVLAQTLSPNTATP